MGGTDFSILSGRWGLILCVLILGFFVAFCFWWCGFFSGEEAEAQKIQQPGGTATEAMGIKAGKNESASRPVQMQLLPAVKEEENQKLEDKWGIRVENLMLTSAGHMLDFRYRVTDPEKALPLFDPAAKPYLVDQATGRKCMVPRPPKVGSLRQITREPEAGRIYYMIFANPARMLKRGSHVTVVIGDFIAENLAVQ